MGYLGDTLQSQLGTLANDQLAPLRTDAENIAIGVFALIGFLLIIILLLIFWRAA